MTQLAYDSKRLAEAVRAGYAQNLVQQLERQKGISFDSRLGEQRFVEMLDKGSYPVALDTGMAMDVQSELVTLSNAGIPWFMLNWQDPKIIAILVAPMMAAVIAGERLVGNWAMETAMFRTAEAVGETSAYGDYADDSGATNVNVNFPQRQNFLFQSHLQYGELELARWGEAQIDWAAQQQVANVLALKKALNFLYFYGIGGLENYGLLNDPSLPPALTATYPWLNSASATANTIYQDVVRMVIQLMLQTNGTARQDDRMVLVMSPHQAVALDYITQYNTNSVKNLLKQNFPNLRIETAPEYGPPYNTSGELIQLIVEEVEGQRTVETAFSSKLRAHTMVPGLSSWRQKRSSGGWGAIWYRPVFCVQMYA
jgi:hypothetical protein